MKRIEKPFCHAVSWVDVYLDDMEQICRLLKEFKGGRVLIKSDNAEFDDFQDLTDHQSERTSRLELIPLIPPAGLSTELFWVEINARQAIVHTCQSPAYEIKGRVIEIETVLKRCRNRVRMVLLTGLFFIISGLSGLCISVTSGDRRSMLIFLFVCLLCPLVFWISWNFHSCRIFLDRRRNAPGFWHRKKDDILLAVISGIIGAVLGTAGTLIAQSLSKGH
jgi:hypothetical protein